MFLHRSSRTVSLLALALLMTGLLSAPVAAQAATGPVRMVSVGADGSQLNFSGVMPNGFSLVAPAISADGQTVAFVRHPGELWLYEETLGYSRKLADAPVSDVRISGDGRSILYLVTEPRPDGQYWQPSKPQSVRLIDTQTGASRTIYQNESYQVTEWDYDYETWEEIEVTRTDYGHGTGLGSVSADGRFVTYTDGPQTGGRRLWRLDRDADANGVFDETGTDQLLAASVTPDAAHHASSHGTSMSNDGRFVVFVAPVSVAVWVEEWVEVGEDPDTFEPIYELRKQLVEQDLAQVFVRDMKTATTTLVSTDDTGAAADGDSTRPQLSAGGSHVLFFSSATNLAGNVNTASGAFVRDLRDGTIASAPAVPSYWGLEGPARLSNDGQTVLFTASRPASVAGGYGVSAYATQVGSGIAEVRADLGEIVSNYDETIGGFTFSGNGRYVAFASNAAIVAEFDPSCQRHLQLSEEELAEWDDPLVEPYDCGNVYRGDLTGADESPTGTVGDEPKTEAAGTSTPETVTTVVTNVVTSITDPIGASITVPEGTSGGSVTIVEGAITAQDAPPSGYELFGQLVEIHAPAASPEAPLQLSFFVHSSVMPVDQNVDDVVIFRNGVALPRCPGATTASEACLVNVVLDEATQTYRFDVLTPQASRWTMGYRVTPPVEAAFLRPLKASGATIQANPVAGDRTLPVKVTLKQGDALITEATAQSRPVVAVSAMASCTAAGTTSAVGEEADHNRTSSTTAQMRWSAEGQAWVYNLDVKALHLLNGTCYRIDVVYEQEQTTGSTFAVVTPRR